MVNAFFEMCVFSNMFEVLIGAREDGKPVAGKLMPMSAEFISIDTIFEAIALFWIAYRVSYLLFNLSV